MLIPVNQAVKYWLGLLMISLFILSTSPSQAANTIAMNGDKLVIASAVQVRQQPMLNTTVITRLKLGTVVRALERTNEQQSIDNLRGYWYLIEANNVKGWVFGGFLRDFSPAKAESSWLQLARERATNAQLGFADYIDTYGFITSILPQIKTKAIKVELEFNRLISLQRSVDRVPFGQDKAQPFKGWLADRKNEVFYDEISGRWLVPVKAYWQLADRAAKTSLGDSIARYAASASLGGECEGDIACNLQRILITDGEYLKRYPKGRYAVSTVKTMENYLKSIQADLKQQPNYFRNDNDSGKALKALIAIIKATNTSSSAKVLVQLQAIQAQYNRFH